MFEQFSYLRRDLRRWKSNDPHDLIYQIFEPGIWATVVYRLNRFLFLINVPVLRFFIRIFCFILFKFSEVLLGVALRPCTEFGPGLHIGHTGLIRINPAVKAGKNLTLAHEVTMGTKGLGVKGAPILGDDVFIGVGAKILGPVKIGNNVRIGANAVVVTDIPDNATAVGVPAKVIER